MELKPRKIMVLHKMTLLRAFNRTIVELKLCCKIIGRIRCRSFNRTIVELKLIFDISHGALGDTFNRTIVELKPFLALSWLSADLA